MLIAAKLPEIVTMLSLQVLELVCISPLIKLAAELLKPELQN